ncbi:FAD-dependent oxidoreductase [Winogradskyella maritima]|uniref:FAD-dependent oxidoreductase n=1 Tax=Winogradskyella maritima TaxID=1517766 RepID=A0ABV8AJZ3_9FLAO|nr:FAD-dependent oxidoreductase [Winogradskyella maritima]
MNREGYKIHIIGAGISGLLAAKTLEAKGYRPIVIEATDRVGGRVKTDIVEGYQLDHGFQVLLSAYPKAMEHLDFEALNLQEFLPGATIFKNGTSTTIGDPLRHLSLLLPTLTSSVGSLSDKLKILKLNLSLKRKSIDAIFKSETTTTLAYLENKGFSNEMINHFFRPFFSGIFLEPDLRTSSRMFEFVYKMFGEGLATLPKEGIGAIPSQLKSQLKTTEFKFNTEVEAVEDDRVIFKDGSEAATHFTIVTANTSKLISNLNNQEVSWKSCQNLYFEVASRSIKKPLIGLISDKDALINNIFFHNSLSASSKGSYELLSVTVVKTHNYSEDQLLDIVIEELQFRCGIEIMRHLKTYDISKALPDMDHLHCDMSPTETLLKPTIVLAGDYLLNGSLNAAMISGERAAQGVIAQLEDGLSIENLSSEYV